MYNTENIKDIKLISNNSGGYIAANRILYQNLINSKITKIILNKATLGTPLIQIGSKTPKILISAGIHGNELPPQAAAIHLINYLIQREIKGTIYIIPFTAPEATMNNTRNFKDRDLNRSAMVKNTLSNIIIEEAKKLKIQSIGDFHSTAINANPGKEGVFSTSKPTFESFKIANYISTYTQSNHFQFQQAGQSFKGALEDEANLEGIPSVTCEVISKNGYIDGNSLRNSFLQMLSFLKYHETI